MASTLRAAACSYAAADSSSPVRERHVRVNRRVDGPRGGRPLTQRPAEGGQGPLGAAHQSVEVDGQDLAGARVFEGAVVVAFGIDVPAGAEVPAGLRTCF